MEEKTTGKILLVEDHDTLRTGIKMTLQDEGHEIKECSTGKEAMEVIERESFDLIITDIKLGDISGIEVMEKAKEINAATEVIIITAFATPETAIKALRLGAFDYVQKPFEMFELIKRVNNALKVRKYRTDIDYFRDMLVRESTVDYLVVSSPAMKKVLTLARKVAPTKATVLITGETGTGKERLATFIHEESPRKNRRLVKVNCAALHENLLESELFGHEKGAFTGAEKTRIGKFEAAHRGSIFLDEIGDMSPATQAKVLRVLQEQEFERLGSNKTIKVDVRVIAATNKDLETEVKKGNFRKDLYYRLNIINIHIPPLRERREDILVLARHFLDRYCLEFSKDVMGFTPEAVRKLENYDWPGNVRELQNVIERAVLLCEGDIIGEDDILIAGSNGTEPSRSEAGGTGNAIGVFADSGGSGEEPPLDLKKMEREKIIEALRQSGFVQKKAAEILGVSPRVLNYKIKVHGIDWKRMKEDYKREKG